MIGVLDAMIDRLLAVEALQFWSLVVLWVVLSLASMGIATAKGRSGGLYLLLGLFLSPVVSMIAAVAQPDKRGEVIDDLRARLAVLEAANAPPPGQAAEGAAMAVDAPAPAAALTLRSTLVSVVVWCVIAALAGGAFLFWTQYRAG